MQVFDEELLNSKYVTIDEKGWHIAEDAPKELKEKFDKYISQIKEQGEILDD